MESIVIATTKEWNMSNYFKLKERYNEKYTFFLITNNEELNKKKLDSINPKYIFFPHWSWIISENIYQNFECVVFHMTDLPYGRGGSPLQNLIIREIYDTKISAIKVSSGIDTGDMYLKENFNISLGSAEEIFIQLSKIIFNKMIPRFLDTILVAKPQKGDTVVFKRRKPDESNLLTLENFQLYKIYDFIRMLDAEGYPKAYIDMNNLKIEFSEVHMKNNKLIGKFEVKENE